MYFLIKVNVNYQIFLFEILCNITRMKNIQKSEIMKTKKDCYGFGKKLPWHFGNEDDFHPIVNWPIILGLKYQKLSEF
jgi:hypothetical protein